METVLTYLLFLTGVGQVVMMAAVIPLPRWLNWRAEAQKLEPVTMQVFWMYAVYIFMTNVFLGVLTFLFATELTDGTPLVTWLVGFMFIYWAGRLFMQLFVIKKEAAPEGLKFRIGEKLLTLLFIFFTATYGWALVQNIRGM